MSYAPYFSADDPVSLAGWLLEEIARGMRPVWPSTRPYADRIVRGFMSLHEERRNDVMEALLTAPDYGHLDWPSLLAPVVEMDAGRMRKVA